MALLLEELCEHLKQMDEITLLERLDISSEEIVDYFKDHIEDRYDSLVKEFTNEMSE